MVILSASALWGLFPIITVLSYHALSPLMSLSVSTAFAALFFGVVISFRKKWNEVFKKESFKYILATTFITGIIYYTLIFFALNYTSTGNVGIISLVEVFFSYVFFHVFKKDFIPKEHVLGAILMIFGASIVLYPNLHEFKVGDILVLVASMIAPFGNFFVRRARKIVGPEAIMFVRSFICSIAFYILAVIFKSTATMGDIKSSFLFIFVNGIFLLGISKIMWIEGIHRISVTKANALSSLSPLLTLFFAWGILKTSPTNWQLISFIPMFFGILLLGKDLSKHKAIYK